MVEEMSKNLNPVEPVTGECPSSTRVKEGKQLKKDSAKAKKQLKSTLRWQRLAIQLLFLVFAPQTFSLAFSGIKQIFDALGQAKAFEMNTFAILLIVLVAFTVVFGRFFCAYLCAFGTVGDVLYQVFDALFKKLHVKRSRIPEGAEKLLRKFKYLVLAFFVVTSFAGLTGTVSLYSPWTAFGRILALNMADLNVAGLLLLLLIAIGMIFKERFFCEFICPLGAVFSLLPILPFSNFRRIVPPCDNCGACKRNCPVSIMPPAEGSDMGECISCGRCQAVCPHDCIGQCSAAKLAARLEAFDTQAAPSASKPLSDESKRSGTPRVVVLAVAAFVVFWLLGAVSHLPILF